MRTRSPISSSRPRRTCSLAREAAVDDECDGVLLMADGVKPARAWTSEYLLGVATALDVVAMDAGSGLLLRANELVEPGEWSDADGEACGSGVALVDGVSDRSDVCDLRDNREVRGSRPAVSSGELSSAASPLSFAAGDEREEVDAVERRYFAGSFLEMASASVCFLKRVSGLSAPGLMLDEAAAAANEMRLDPPVGVGRPDRRWEALGVVGMPDDMITRFHLARQGNAGTRPEFALCQGRFGGRILEGEEEEGNESRQMK